MSIMNDSIVDAIICSLTEPNSLRANHIPPLEQELVRNYLEKYTVRMVQGDMRQICKLCLNYDGKSVAAIGSKCAHKPVEKATPIAPVVFEVKNNKKKWTPVRRFVVPLKFPVYKKCDRQEGYDLCGDYNCTHWHSQAELAFWIIIDANRFRESRYVSIPDEVRNFLGLESAKGAATSNVLATASSASIRTRTVATAVAAAASPPAAATATRTSTASIVSRDESVDCNAAAESNRVTVRTRRLMLTACLI
jgi:hypothetical protein